MSVSVTGIAPLIRNIMVENEDFAGRFGINIPGNVEGGSGARYNYGPGDNPIQNLEAFSVNELSRTRTGRERQFTDSILRTANREDEAQRVADARAAAKTSADVAEGVFSRKTRGAALSERQKMGAQQQFSINRAVTQADAAGTARRGVNASALAAARAGQGFDDIAFGQQLAAMTGLANADGQRQVRESAEKANKKSSRNSLIGTIIGIGASLFPSSEEFKKQTEEAPSLLKRLNKVRVDKWKYHGGDRDHIGPYAEEFNETFGVGKKHEQYLNVLDVLGVTLGSIKELNEKVESLG
jgi:hypothetical protein